MGMAKWEATPADNATAPSKLEDHVKKPMGTHWHGVALIQIKRLCCMDIDKPMMAKEMWFTTGL